jgi:hypothetical protein
MDGDRIERRSGRLRSFVIGGVVGASAAIAAARRVRPRPRRRPTPAGLAAFEEAPCYEETVELEERLVRERRRTTG